MIDTLERLPTAARDVRRIAVVEVPGQEAGWLALQAGLAVCADVVLIPEIAYDLEKIGRPCVWPMPKGGGPRWSSSRKALAPFRSGATSPSHLRCDAASRLMRILNMAKAPP